MSWVRYLIGDSPLTLTFLVHRPGAAVRLPRDRLGSLLDRRDHPVRSRPLPRRELVDRDHPDHRCPISRSAILRRAFVSVALVLGEFTIASLLHYDTLPVVVRPVRLVRRPIVGRASLACSCSHSLLLFVISFFEPPAQDVGGVIVMTTDCGAGQGLAVELADLTPRLRHLQRARRSRPAPRARRDGGAARPVRLWQDHRTADPGRARPSHVGQVRSTARTCPGFRPTSATWGWCSRPTASSRT